MTSAVGIHLTHNVVRFCRLLRQAGLSVATEQVIDSLRGLREVGVERRDDVRAALRCTLVSRREQIDGFDAAFDALFVENRPDSQAIPTDTSGGAPTAKRGPLGPGDTVHDMHRGPTAASKDAESETGGAGTPSFSAVERLRRKDFESMSADEKRQSQRLLAEGLSRMTAAASRRFQIGHRGERVDLRRSMRQMVRNDGRSPVLAWKKRRIRPTSLILLCDISASMRDYSRMFLLFAHALSAENRRVHSFVFGTRLSDVTRRLRQRNADVALAEIADDVRDWDGGTRIAAALGQFNRRFSRQVPTGDSAVILLSDGLERDTAANLAFETERLRRSCRELIWLNPLLRFDGFAPSAYGIRTMLPHVNRLVPAHNVNNLLALARAVKRDGQTVWSSLSQKSAA